MEAADLKPNPFEQFSLWFKEAEQAQLPMPNAMALATSGKDQQPSVRMVLLKGFDEENGFQFFTNYHSRKAEQLTDNPKAALLFYWQSIGKQIRIEGTVSKLTSADSTAYFQSRPRGSQIGAWASKQSQVIGSRNNLQAQVAEIEKKFVDTEPLPCPEFWGGYVLKPHHFEFWLEGADRLHDRFVYQLTSGGFTVSRLQP